MKIWILLLSLPSVISGFSPNLPESLLPHFYSQYPGLDPRQRPVEAAGQRGPTNPNGGQNNNEKCWGYEPGCKKKFRFSSPSCPGDFTGWASSRSEAEDLFYNQADFGFVKEQIKELKNYCKDFSASNSSTFSGSSSSASSTSTSSLLCSKNLMFCMASHLLLDLRHIKDRSDRENLRYKMDVLSPGDIQVHCNLDQDGVNKQLEFISPLQSWAPELRNIRESKESITAVNPSCDVYIDKPVYIMKLDATVNMYHHFCDFFNLFASLFIRDAILKNGTEQFNRNNQILIWENMKYYSNFGAAWEAFTENPVQNLETFIGKRVCFKEVVFPLLPRMLFGLYYNTPLVPGCLGSGLFKSFSDFILHRLDVPGYKPTQKLRLTLLARKTKYRRIENEAELVNSLQKSGRFEVNLARFDHRVPFKFQLEAIKNTDILVGIHGAGLTHMLFLPDWAGVFELYHCEDPGCYSDLARLRGLKYLTWEKINKLTSLEAEGSPYSGPAHQKFRNYKFDVEEFMRLISILEDRVREDNRFKDSRDKMKEDKSETKKDKMKTDKRDENEKLRFYEEL